MVNCFECIKLKCEKKVKAKETGKKIESEREARKDHRERDHDKCLVTHFNLSAPTNFWW